MTGEDLATLRKSLHMTQEVFAKRIGIDRAHLARVEANKGGIISDTMALRVNSIFSHTPKTDSEWLIDFYDFDVTAMPKDFFSDSSIKPTTKLDLPGFAGATFAINVAGHAMAPSIEPGSMIIVKEVTDKDIILYGEVYLLITEDYRIVRRLRKCSKRDCILACSDNETGPNGKVYEDVEIPRDKILHLFLVMGSVKRFQL